MSVLMAFVVGVSGFSPAVADSAPVSVVQTVCAERANPTDCDADGDRITDSLEKQVCGSATCSTGREDRDKDGIPDWVEFTACGSARCADPGADLDGDGIPDFAEMLTCGSWTCSTGREDVDGDKIGDWVEYVICGDSTCANGSEDYDADGISDAKQLSACVVAFDVTTPAVWGQGPVAISAGPSGIVFEFVWWPIWVGAGLSLLGLLLLGWALWAQRKRDEQRETEFEDDVVVAELLGLDS